MKIYYANITPLYDINKYQNLYSKLPPSRQKRVNNYIQDEDKIRSVGAFSLLLKLLNDMNISYQEDDFKIDDKGKLYLANSNIYLNISHSNKYVIAAISENPIGVDVEAINPNKKIDELVKYVLNDKEKEDYKNNRNKINYFFEIWSKKESYTKCLGRGLQIAMPTIDLTKLDDYHFYSTVIKNHQFAICSKNKPVVKIEEIKF